MTTRAFVGLGGNLGDAAATLRDALAALDTLPATRVDAASSLYRNPPMVPRGARRDSQPPYVNAVAALATGLDAGTLLGHMLAIERAAGRERTGARWAPRTLDLDLLLYGDEVRADATLTLPHPGVHHRPFVIHPLAEIAPDVLIPGHGTAAALAAQVCADGLVRLSGRDG